MIRTVSYNLALSANITLTFGILLRIFEKIAKKVKAEVTRPKKDNFERFQSNLP